MAYGTRRHGGAATTWARVLAWAVFAALAAGGAARAGEDYTVDATAQPGDPGYGVTLFETLEALRTAGLVWADGDTITLAGDDGSLTAPFDFGTKSVTIRGNGAVTPDNPAATNAQFAKFANSLAFVADAGKTLEISGFDSTALEDLGGAVNAIGGTTLTFGEAGGAGAYRFDGNQALYGAAVYSRNDLIFLSGDYAFTGNTAVTSGLGPSGWGGAVFAGSNLALLSGDYRFEGNHAETLGGAIYVNRDATLIADGGDILFRGNTTGANPAAPTGANALYAYNGGGDTLTLAAETGRSLLFYDPVASEPGIPGLTVHINSRDGGATFTGGRVVFDGAYWLAQGKDPAANSTFFTSELYGDMTVHGGTLELAGGVAVVVNDNGFSLRDGGTLLANASGYVNRLETGAGTGFVIDDGATLAFDMAGAVDTGGANATTNLKIGVGGTNSSPGAVHIDLRDFGALAVGKAYNLLDSGVLVPALNTNLPLNTNLRVYGEDIGDTRADMAFSLGVSGDLLQVTKNNDVPNATVYWNADDGPWNATARNWTDNPGGVAGVDRFWHGDTVVFGDARTGHTAGGAININKDGVTIGDQAGLTITAGDWLFNGGEIRGGAIHFADDSSATFGTLNDCYFRSMTQRVTVSDNVTARLSAAPGATLAWDGVGLGTENLGGAVFIDSFSSLTLSGGADGTGAFAFTGNKVDGGANVNSGRGGAVYANGDLTFAAGDYAFTGNTASGAGLESGQGGAAYAGNNLALLSGGYRFEGNHAETLGGAIYANRNATLIADGGDILFRGNTTGTNPAAPTGANALFAYNQGNDKTLTLAAETGRSLLFYDPVASAAGTPGLTVHINSRDGGATSTDGRVVFDGAYWLAQGKDPAANSTFFTSTVYGATIVHNGTMAVQNDAVYENLGAGDFDLLAGATLAGDGTVKAVTQTIAGTLAPGADAGGVATLALAGNVALDGATLAIDIGDAANDRVAVAGAVSFGTGNTVAASTTTSGTYDILTSTVDMTLADGNFSPVTGAGPDGYSYVRGSGVHLKSGDSRTLQLTFDTTRNLALTWTGAASENWHNTGAGDPNWTDGAASGEARFKDGDGVVFDDTKAATFNIAVDAGGVTTGTIAFADDHAWTFTGGAITAGGNVAQTADGAVTFATLNLGGATNTFAGLYTAANTGLGLGATNAATTFTAKTGSSLGNVARAGQGDRTIAMAGKDFTADKFTGGGDGGITVNARNMTITDDYANSGAVALTGGGTFKGGTAEIGGAYGASSTGLYGVAVTVAAAAAPNFGAVTSYDPTASSIAAVGKNLALASVANDGLGGVNITASGLSVGGTYANSGTVNVVDGVTFNAAAAVSGSITAGGVVTFGGAGKSHGMTGGDLTAAEVALGDGTNGSDLSFSGPGAVDVAKLSGMGTFNAVGRGLALEQTVHAVGVNLGTGKLTLGAGGAGTASTLTSLTAGELAIIAATTGKNSLSVAALGGNGLATLRLGAGSAMTYTGAAEIALAKLYGGAGASLTSGGTVALTGDVDPTGTLAVTGDVRLDGATLHVAPESDTLAVTGTVSFTAAGNTVDLDAFAIYTDVPLITATGAMTGDAASLFNQVTINGSALGTRQNAALSITGNALSLTTSSGSNLDLNWTGGDAGAWGATGEWDVADRPGMTDAFNQSDSVRFAGAAPTTVDVTGGATVSGMAVSAGDYTFAGGKITGNTTAVGDRAARTGKLEIAAGASAAFRNEISFTNGIANKGALAFAPAAAWELSSVISEAGSVAVTGGERLTISGANTATGQFTQSGGEVALKTSWKGAFIQTDGLLLTADMVKLEKNAAFGGMVDSTGTLSVGGDLTLEKASLAFTPGSDVIEVAGTVAFGADKSAIDLSSFTAGQTPLLISAGSFAGTTANFDDVTLNGGEFGTRQQAVLSLQGGELYVVMTAGNSAALSWKGGDNRVWSTSGAWTVVGGFPGEEITFNQQDAVVFDGTAGGTVEVLGGATVSGMRVTGGEYRFEGGGITGQKQVAGPDVVPTGKLELSGNAGVTFANNISFSDGIDVEPGSAITLERSTDFDLTSGISGGGDVVKTGSAGLTLSGGNTNTGDLVQREGGLTLASNWAGDVVQESGAGPFAAASGATIAGAASFTGDVDVDGALSVGGTLTLNGAVLSLNPEAGDRLNAASVQLSGTTTVNLDTVPAGVYTFLTGAVSGFVDASSFATTYRGAPLSDRQKAEYAAQNGDSVVLTISVANMDVDWRGGGGAWHDANWSGPNDNRYADGDTVHFRAYESGRVNLGGAVMPGSVTVHAGADYGLYGGTVTATGTFTVKAGGLLDLDVSNTAVVADSIVFEGTVTLSGYERDKTSYDNVLTSASAMDAARMSELFDLDAALRRQTAVFSNSYTVMGIEYIEKTLGGFVAATPGVDFDAGGVTGALDAAFGQGGLSDIEDALYGMAKDGDVVAALDYLRGEELVAGAVLSMNIAKISVAKPLRLWDGLEEDVYATTAAASAASESAYAQWRLTEAARWRFHAEGLAEWSRYNGRSGGHDYRGRVFGGVFGLDRQVAGNLRLGAALAVTHGRLTADAHNGRTSGDGAAGMLYANYRQRDWFVSGVAQYGGADMKSRRRGMGWSATAEYNSHWLGAGASAGRRFALGDWRLLPSASVLYTNLRMPGITESGTSGALRQERKTWESLEFEARMEVSRRFRSRDGIWVWMPRATLGMAVEALDAEMGTRLGFAGQQGVPTFAGRTPDVGRASLRVGAGFQVEWNDRVRTSLDYEGEFRSRKQTHGGRFRVEVAF